MCVVQCSKEQQDHLALAVTNPVYALLLKLWPWHPKAKRNQHNKKMLMKVRLQGVLLATLTFY